MTNKQQNNEKLNPYQPPQSMQDIDLHTEVVAYPIIKVIIGYAILGTLCGAVVSILGELIRESFVIKNKLDWIFGTIVVSAIGFMPALITGVILAWRKLFIKSFLDYVKIALLGLIISVSYGFLLLCFFIGIDRIRNETGDIFLLMGLVGAISAVIVGKLLLPKK